MRPENKVGPSRARGPGWAREQGEAACTKMHVYVYIYTVYIYMSYWLFPIGYSLLIAYWFAY